MRSLDLELRTRPVFGAGSVARVGELARELGAQRALLVTAPGIAAAGHAGRAEAALEAAGLVTRCFADLREDPTTDDVDACLAAARDFGPVWVPKNPIARPQEVLTPPSRSRDAILQELSVPLSARAE